MFGLAKANVSVELVEPLIFLSKPPSWSAYFSNDGSNSSPCQLRGIVTIDSTGKMGMISGIRNNKDGSEERIVRIRLLGKSRSVTWQKGIANEEELVLHDQSIYLPITPPNRSTSSSPSSSAISLPFSISIPSDLPPTIDTEFGRVHYSVSATVLADKDSKSVLGQTKEGKVVHLVYDAAIPLSNNTEGLSLRSYDDGGRMRTVQDDWHDLFHWRWTSMTDCATAAGYVPLQLSILRIGKIQDDSPASLKSIEIILTEETHVTTGSTSSSSGPDVVRRRWTLRKIQGKDTGGLMDLLPMNRNHRLRTELVNAAQKGIVSRPANGDVKASSNSTEGDEETAFNHLINPNGPWTLSWDVQLPVCAKTRCNSSIIHPKSPVRVTHTLHVLLTFQESKGKDSFFEVESSIPFTIRSIYLTDPYSQLPCYWCSCFLPHPYEAREERSEGGILAYHEPQPQSMTVEDSPINQGSQPTKSNTFMKNTSITSDSGSIITLNHHQHTAQLWNHLTAREQQHQLPPSYSESVVSA